MRLTPSERTVLAVLLLAGAVLAAEPALARSSLGIGTAEAGAAPGGPFAGLFVEISVWQRSFFTALRKALVAMRDGGGGTAGLVALSFAYGIFHAAGPGHGKAVISSYVLADEAQLKRGIVLSFVSALVQAATAVVVVGLGWFVLRGTSVSMTDATNALEIASFALVAVFGAWLVLRKGARILARRRPAFAAPGLAMAGLAFEAPAGGRGAIMAPASRGLPAHLCSDTEADGTCGCGRSHMPDPRTLGGGGPMTLGTAASAVFAVGLRPCTGAIVVLTFALLNGLYAGGLLSVLAMAVGTAVTVSAIAALAVFAKGAALRFARPGRSQVLVLDALELSGAFLVLALGLLLLGGALA